MTKSVELEGLDLLGDGESFRSELCEMIENAPMFSSLSRHEVETLSDYMRGYRAKAGATVFEEGSKGLFMCVLVEGRVEILRDTPDEGKKKVTKVRPGKSMGEMSLLDGLPHSATSIASEDCILLLLTKMNFEKLAEEHPILYSKLLSQIARLMSLRLRQTTGILLDYLDNE
jgi:CRP/FNR family cyclic AMP-dependent transcriptional regulator